MFAPKGFMSFSEIEPEIKTEAIVICEAEKAQIKFDPTCIKNPEATAFIDKKSALPTIIENSKFQLRYVELISKFLGSDMCYICSPDGQTLRPSDWIITHHFISPAMTWANPMENTKIANYWILYPLIINLTTGAYGSLELGAVDYFYFFDLHTGTIRVKEKQILEEWTNGLLSPDQMPKIKQQIEFIKQYEGWTVCKKESLHIQNGEKPLKKSDLVRQAILDGRVDQDGREAVAAEIGCDPSLISSVKSRMKNNTK